MPCSNPRQTPNDQPSRRDAIASGLSLSAALLVGPDLLGRLDAAPRTGEIAARPYLDTARQAARWIARSAIVDDKGMRWPADPANPKAPELDLYNGTSGVIPFWLELHAATGDARAREYAGAGADYLLSTLPTGKVPSAGLYEGLAGTAWVLAMTHRVTKERRHGEGAARAHAMIKAAAEPDPSGKGVRWADSTDIISGGAGTGLYLLWAQRELRDPSALDVAVRAGQALVAAGEPVGDGLRWKVNATIQRNYPNFSHGTGGVAYFLATLHQATGERAFLDAALAGARYLNAIATSTPNGGRMVFHSEPGNEKLFYLSWCHGPSGLARLYHRLGAITGDTSYLASVEQLAAATVDMKVPERSPGYWNNISQCCGNCGVAEFFTSLYLARHDQRHLAFAVRVAQDAIARGTVDGDGMKWVQAENRVSPNAVVAQTGLMQGAAGVGLAMLHLDGAISGRKPAVVLPDNPFG
jgi:lantibiotic modifying enzyme